MNIPFICIVLFSEKVLAILLKMPYNVLIPTYRVRQIMKYKKAPKKLDKNSRGEVWGYDFEEKVLGGLPVLVFIQHIDEDGCEIALYDRKGYRAHWVERKLSERQWESLCERVEARYLKDSQDMADDIAIERYISSSSRFY